MADNKEIINDGLDEIGVITYLSTSDVSKMNKKSDNYFRTGKEDKVTK